MARAVDQKAAKERKQKKIAAVGGVLLVIVLFVQVPRMMRMLNSDEEAAGAAVPSAPAPAAAGTTTPIPVAPATSPMPETVTTASLVSFSRFASKDPFVQQVKEKEGGQPDGAASPGTPDAAGPEDGAIGGSPTEGGKSPPAAKGSAEIEVNGVAETVSVGAAFPAATPMFLLASVSAKSVAIKVADGGSFTSGDPALKLVLGKPVTLVNTADGTRFVLRLKAAS